MSTATKKIAILAKSDALASAIRAVIAPRLAGAEYITVSKISDVPTDAYALASFQMPSYIPASSGTKVMIVGSRMTKDEAERKASFELIRNAAASAEDIIPELGDVNEITVIGSRFLTTTRLALAEHRANIAEAADPAAKAAATQAGYEFLLGIVNNLTSK